MEIEHVDGENKGKIMLYALSTCGWCRKTKEFLTKLGVSFDYIFVDYLEGDDRDITMDEIEKWNPRRSFPTIVINDKDCIVGFKEDKIKGVLGL
jgi:glutaredoxin